MTKALILSLISLLLLIPISGCAGVSLAAAGTVAGIAATALTTGADVYSNGKLDSADLVVSADDWLAAVRSAGADLRLSMVDQKMKKPHEWFLHFEDNQRAPVKVTVQERTPTIVRCRIDVGLFGNEPTARLMLARIRLHATPAAKPATQESPVAGAERTLDH